MLTESMKTSEFRSAPLKLPSAMIHDHAFVTWVDFGGDKEYIDGAIALCTSLHDVVKTRFPVICMYTGDNDRFLGRLKKSFDWTVKVPRIYVRTRWSRFNSVFSKLHMLRLTQCKSVLFMDADYMPLKNMDMVFEVSAPAGVLETSIDKEAVQYGYNIAYPNVTHGARIPRSITDACSHEGSQVWNQINAGLMLLRPSLSDFSRIVKAAHKGATKDFLFPEQEFLTLYWSGRWHALDMRYNVQPGKKMPSTVFGVHFTYKSKPWLNPAADKIVAAIRKDPNVKELHEHFYDLLRLADSKMI